MTTKEAFSIQDWGLIKILQGIFLIILFSLASYQIASLEIIKALKIDPVIIGLILGVIYGNSLGHNSPSEWQAGINFCQKNILNLAIILYGFKLTFQDLFQIGWMGFVGSLLIVISTLIITLILGKYWFKLDWQLSFLMAAGNSICGSAAVLATGLILKSKSHKNIIAVTSSFFFGTVAMFLFPLIYKLGIIPISEDKFGIFLGLTLQSVGNVAGASAIISEIVEKNAIIIKMMRVMMLVPFLLLLGIFSDKFLTIKNNYNHKNIIQKPKILIPWFAVIFIIMIVINSWLQPATEIINAIDNIGKFSLTMAMIALGIETNGRKIQEVGFKPIYLGLISSIWLTVVSFYFVYFIT